ncbi:MAG: hypothetical protein AAF694_12505 [Bacteroidota bacterium]
MKVLQLFLLIAPLFIFIDTSAQTLDSKEAFMVDLELLPEYVIVTSESTGRLLGSIMIYLESKNSAYESALEELEEVLTSKEKLRIQNQTDLLNAMIGLGFEYVDAFSAGQSDMTKMIFRKKSNTSRSDDNP